ncbi:hypothetical protein ACQP2K_26015 [Microbispora siamensis]
MLVSNTRGIDARRPTSSAGHGTHDTTSSLQRFTLPDDREIAKYTARVFAQNGWGKNDVKKAEGNKQKAVAVPKRLGDPSTIKHVFLIVKENRTYDQVFGDIPQGNGDPSLAQYGENVTPNQHALARQFGLYDNTYDIGTNSAEGHNWLMQADNPEYTESSAGEYLRSYDTWGAWKSHQAFNGPNARADSGNPEQMNRFSWYEAHDYKKPYPGDDEIYAPDQVPGAYIPSSDNDG